MGTKQPTYDSGYEIILSQAERNRSSILVVEPSIEDKGSIRQGLRALAYNDVTIVSDHVEGIKAFEDTKFSHVIFSVKETSIPVAYFVEHILNFNKKVIAIASSSELGVEQVFQLLKAGTRGYLLKPFTGDTLDCAIGLATKGDPISDVVLRAEDRNQAFAAVIGASLDRLAICTKQARDYQTARMALRKMLSQLQRSVQLGKLFAKGGEEHLQEALVDFFINTAKAPTTRLGKIRSQLKQDRTKRVKTRSTLEHRT